MIWSKTAMDAEIQAFKTELTETVVRRFGSDPHRDSLAIAVSATAMTLADLIKSAGDNQDHRDNLREIAKMMLDATT
jgi:hypothetical protein